MFRPKIHIMVYSSYTGSYSKHATVWQQGRLTGEDPVPPEGGEARKVCTKIVKAEEEGA
jgi:hypothetical protein